jgi:hypothetical protein
MSQTRLAAALVAAAMLAPGAALACTVAGPKTHIGALTDADPANGTFSILDAETQQPLTFSAEPQVIDSLVGKQGPVRVEFEEAGDALTATDVQR